MTTPHQQRINAEREARLLGALMARGGRAWAADLAADMNITEQLARTILSALAHQGRVWWMPVPTGPATLRDDGWERHCRDCVTCRDVALKFRLPARDCEEGRKLHRSEMYGMQALGTFTEMFTVSRLVQAAVIRQAKSIRRAGGPCPLCEVLDGKCLRTCAVSLCEQVEEIDVIEMFTAGKPAAGG